MRSEGEQCRLVVSRDIGVPVVSAPADQVDEIVDHYPDVCGGCGREFPDPERLAEAAVRPSPGRGVAADQRELDRASACISCVARDCRLAPAPAPAGIAGSPFGPRLQAAIVTFTAGTASLAAGS